MTQPSSPPSSYLSLAQSLPQPSPAQCERFVLHIASDRPWHTILPLDGGAPCLAFLDPCAGAPGDNAATARYHEQFGWLAYALPAPADPVIRDAEGRAVALPADLRAAATCTLNAMIYPSAEALIETLPARAPALLRPSGVAQPLAPIRDDADLRAFADVYVREELAGFQCPDDRAAWELRQFQAFQLLHAPRRAEQLARLRRALDAMLAWVYAR